MLKAYKLLKSTSYVYHILRLIKKKLKIFLQLQLKSSAAVHSGVTFNMISVLPYCNTKDMVYAKKKHFFL